MKGKTHPRLREFYRSLIDYDSIPVDDLTLGGRLAMRMNTQWEEVYMMHGYSVFVRKEKDIETYGI